MKTRKKRIKEKNLKIKEERQQRNHLKHPNVKRVPLQRRKRPRQLERQFYPEDLTSRDRVVCFPALSTPYKHISRSCWDWLLIFWFKLSIWISCSDSAGDVIGMKQYRGFGMCPHMLLFSQLTEGENKVRKRLMLWVPLPCLCIFDTVSLAP